MDLFRAHENVKKIIFFASDQPIFRQEVSITKERQGEVSTFY